MWVIFIFPRRYRSEWEVNLVAGIARWNLIRMRTAINAKEINCTMAINTFTSGFRRVVGVSYGIIHSTLMVVLMHTCVNCTGDADSDDMSAGSSASMESSPTASPYQSHHQTLIASLSAVELNRAVDEDTTSEHILFSSRSVSKWDIWQP